MTLAPPPVERLHGLTTDEYALAVEALGRVPNEVELGMFGAMWSEHCALQALAAAARASPAATGLACSSDRGENAGAVDIGDGLAVVFKVESHNHPSAVEPYQGAATGVGGIIRDVFTMGARPIALLNSLRFGPLEPDAETDAATAARNRYLFGGVVAGIAGYGNCIGIPDVGGEVTFDPTVLGQPARQRDVRRDRAARRDHAGPSGRGGQHPPARRRGHRPRRDPGRIVRLARRSARTVSSAARRSRSATPSSRSC